MRQKNDEEGTYIINCTLDNHSLQKIKLLENESTMCIKLTLFLTHCKTTKKLETRIELKMTCKQDYGIMLDTRPKILSYQEMSQQCISSLD